MLKVIYALFTFLITLSLSGCMGSTPDIPQYNIDTTDNIGYIIKTNPKMIHTFIGTTVFNNFEKEYPKQVKKEDVEVLLKENLNVHLVDLSIYNFESLNNLITEVDGQWSISNKALYDELLTKYNLKAILIVSETSGSAYVYPDYLSSKSSGLLSRSFMGIQNHFAISGFHFKLNLLRPIAVQNIYKDILSAKLIYNPYYNDYQKKSGFIKPTNDENLTVDEQKSIKKSILELTKNNIQIVNKYLINSK